LRYPTSGTCSYLEGTASGVGDLKNVKNKTMNFARRDY